MRCLILAKCQIVSHVSRPMCITSPMSEPTDQFEYPRPRKLPRDRTAPSVGESVYDNDNIHIATNCLSCPRGEYMGHRRREVQLNARKLPPSLAENSECRTNVVKMQNFVETQKSCHIVVQQSCYVGGTVAASTRRNGSDW